MDDAFAELEAQLAEISQINVSARPTARQTNTSSWHAAASPASNYQTQVQNTPPTSQMTALQLENDQLRQKVKETQAKADQYQNKLQTMVSAVKEEREIQQRHVEELEQKVQSAEARSEQLEEKLIKLVELVKRERASKVIDSASVGQNVLDIKSLKEAQNRNVELEETVKQLTMQVEALEKELYNQEDLRNQERSLNAQLQDELSEQNTKLSASEVQLSKLVAELQQTKILLDQEKKKPSSGISQEQVHQLEERAKKAEVLASDYEAKIARLVTAVKTERQQLRDKVQAAEDRAAALERRLSDSPRSSAVASSPRSGSSDTAVLETQLREAEQRANIAEERCRRAEERADDLEQRLATASSASFSAPSSTDLDGPPGPPPPPPPPPSIKLIDSTKLVIKRADGTTAVGKPRAVDPRVENMAGLIDEIKKGIKLRSVAQDIQPRTPGRSEGVDLGALANDIVKLRQTRMQQKSAAAKASPRKSTALTNLLKELDGL